MWGRTPKFNIGDEVILLDGRDNDPFNVGWVYNDGGNYNDDNMDDRIGQTLTIRRCRTEYDSIEYKVEGSDWWYSEVWLEPANKCTFSDENKDLDELFGDVCAEVV